jgi:hypothetical protein
MNEVLRTERSFGVTSELKPIQRRNLLNVRNSEAWPDVLDVLEMCCIEIETRLINTDPAKSEEVLANHKLAKAAWVIFTQFQEKIDSEIAVFLASVAPKSAMPELTPREQLIENILDPTKGNPELDDMGII